MNSWSQLKKRLLRWIGWTRRALLVATIAVPIVAAAQGRQLQFASTAWSPFTNPTGQPRFALDLVEEALRRAGTTVATVMVGEEKLTPSLLSGEFDGSAAIWKDAERESVLLYSKAYLQNRLILVGRAGSDVSANSLADLSGKRLALVAGYSYGEALDTTDGPIMVASASEEDSVRKLLDGKADYTLMDELVIQYLLRYHDEARTRLAFGATPLLVRSLHLAIRRSLPEAESIIAGFNAEIILMMVDRSYHRLLHLDWISVDVDGDGLSEYLHHKDGAGYRPPQRSYQLFAAEKRASEHRPTRRFYLGDDIYEGWSNVPDRYKSSAEPDRRAEGLRIFTFRF